jgi:ATP synthase protein I
MNKEPDGMDDDARKARLTRLEERISEAKKTQEPQPRSDQHYSQANMAWRMVIELVAGLGLGFGIGFGMDTVFGTTPIFMVLFILLGFVAGVRTMLRTAQEIQDKNAAEADEDEGSKP